MDTITSGMFGEKKKEQRVMKTTPCVLLCVGVETLLPAHDLALGLYGSN